MKITYEIGLCPKCGSENLDYGRNTYEDNTLCIPFECSDRGAKGEEIFSLDYLRTELMEGE